MTWGKITPAMKDALKRIIDPFTTVVDFGCGDLGHARTILECTPADRVIAIDRGLGAGAAFADRKIEFVLGAFEDAHVKARVRALRNEGGRRVGFVSWPAQHGAESLPALLDGFDYVVYLGDNIRSGCGDRNLFLWLCDLDVLDLVEDPRNTMAVYGGESSPGTLRTPIPEELAFWLARDTRRMLPEEDIRTELREKYPRGHVELVRMGLARQIYAIKAIREITKYPLREARAVVDTFDPKVGPVRLTEKTGPIPGYDAMLARIHAWREDVILRVVPVG